MPKKYKCRKSFSFEGKRYYVYGDTQKEVYEKMARRKMELEEGITHTTSSMTVREWSLQAADTYRINQTEETRKNMLKRMKVINDIIGNMKLKDVKPVHCQQVLNEHSGQSKGYIHLIYLEMNFIFSKAVANDLIRKNPVDDVIRPSGTGGSRRALTAYEREHMLAVALSDRKYYVFAFMMLCGCRPMEAAKIRRYDISVWEDIPVLHIRGTKTEGSDRYVPVPAELYELVKDIPADELILQTKSESVIGYNAFRRRFIKYRNAVNINMGCKATKYGEPVPPFRLANDITMYNLRHEYCTELARQGIDVRIAQKLMGHKSLKLTADIYTNLNDTDVISAYVKATQGSTQGTPLKPIKSR